VSLLCIVASTFFVTSCKLNAPAPTVCKQPFDVVLTPMATPTPAPADSSSDNGPPSTADSGQSGSGSSSGHSSSGNFLQDLFDLLFGHHSHGGGHSGGSSGGSSGDSSTTPHPQKAGLQRFVFDLAPLYSTFNDPVIKIESLDLNFQIDGHYYGKDGEISIDINGIQLYGNGHGRHYQVRKFDSHLNRSWCSFHGAQMRRNGAEPLFLSLQRIFFHRGKLIVNIHSRSKDITNVTLEVAGYRMGDCGSPTPTPSVGESPTPTTTPSASPSAAPTATPVPTPQNTPTPTPFPAPVTTIQSIDPAEKTTAATHISFTFASDQSGSNFLCSLDGATATACTSPQLYSGLTNGTHQFQVTAINAEGTADPNGAAYSWTVNTTPPSVTITSTWPSVTNRTDFSVAFQSADATTYHCSIDGAEATECTSPLTAQDLGEGAHSVSITAVNWLGVESDSPATFQWRIDLTAPDVQFTSVTPDENFVSNRSITLGFAANETSSFECNLDGLGYTTCTSPATYDGLTDGNHAFVVRATDVAGNVSVPATYTWTVDTTPPNLILGAITPPQGPTNATTVSVEFAADEIANYNCSLDGAAASACTSPWVSAIQTEGLHELQIQAIDQAGNVSDVTSVQWLMDFTLPTLVFGQMLPSPATYLNSSSFQAEILPSEQVVLSCTLNGYDVQQPTSPVMLSNLAEGSYHLNVVGTDSAGNESAALTHDFIVDLTPPVVSVSATANDTTTAETMNTFTFSANEDASYQCEVDGAGFSACASPLVVSGFANGDHVFEVKATDLAGNVSEVAAVAWTVDTDTTPPIATTPQTTVTSNSVTVTWTTNEPATSKVVYGLKTALDQTTDEDMTLVTEHSVTVTGLTPNTVYTVQGAGQDASGNAYLATKKLIRTLP